MRCRILSYFNKTDFLDKKFCCIDFVNFVFDKFIKLNQLNIDEWKFSNLENDTQIQPGVAVCLTETNPLIKKNERITLDIDHFEPKHLAIYLGKTIYMSLFGAIESLHFTTLEEMKKAYRSSTVLLMYPRYYS